MNDLQESIFSYQFEGKKFEIIAKILSEHLNCNTSTLSTHWPQVVYLIKFKYWISIENLKIQDTKFTANFYPFSQNDYHLRYP